MRKNTSPFEEVFVQFGETTFDGRTGRALTSLILPHDPKPLRLAYLATDRRIITEVAWQMLFAFSEKWLPAKLTFGQGKDPIRIEFVSIGSFQDAPIAWVLNIEPENILK